MNDVWHYFEGDGAIERLGLAGINWSLVGV